MKLVKGGKSDNDRAETERDSSSDTQTSLFYARAFYELPSPCLIVQISDDHRVIDVNRHGVAALSLNPLEIIGTKFEDLLCSTLTVRTLEALAEVDQLTGTSSSLTDVTLTAAAVPRTFELLGVNSMSSLGERYLIMFFKAQGETNAGFDQQQRLDRSLTDALTGLPNTFAAERNLDLLCNTVFRKSKNFAVVLCSLDAYRQESAHFSSKFASQLMLAMALRLRNWASGEGIFLARYRSDEFLLVIHDRADFRDILDGLYAELTRELIADGISFTSATHMGVYLHDVWDAVSAEGLLLKARKAAERARLEGGDRYVVYSDRMEQLAPDADYTQAVIDGFRRREFCLHFQPVVSLESGHIGMVEGLLRWTRPDSGIQRPLEFLESIEDSSVYNEVGLWVLDLALLTLEAWTDSKSSVNLCINLKARQLCDEGFVDKAMSVIANYPPSVAKKLSIDLISLSQVQDVTALVTPLMRLGSRGLRFSLDDFGVGDAKLLSQAPLPIDSLKISQSYVANVDDDLGSMFIIQNIIEFARKYDVAVYAKGVETSRQYNLLRALGCAGAQGYVIAKPLSAPELTSYLESSEHHQEPTDSGSGPKEISGNGIFSFALAEHKMLLREMLNQTVSDSIDRNDQNKGLGKLLKSVNNIKVSLPGDPEKESTLASIEEVVKQLLIEVSDKTEGDINNSNHSETTKAVVLKLSDLLAAFSGTSG